MTRFRPRQQLHLLQRQRGSFAGLLLSTLLIAAVIIALNSLAVLSYQQQVPTKTVSMMMLDDQAVQTPQQALQQAAGQWQPLLDKGRQLGYHRGSLWFKLQFEPDANFALELAAPYLDDVRFYVLNANGDLVHEVQTGDQQPFAQRPLPSSSLLFPIQHSWTSESYQYLFRLENSGAIVFPLHYLETSPQLALLQQRNVLHGFFLGLMVFASLLAVLLALVTQQHSYALFSGLLLCIAAVQAEINGFSFQWLWPENPGLNHLVEWGLPLAVLCCSGFVRSFFQLQSPSRLRQMLLLIEVTAVLLLVATVICQLLVQPAALGYLKQSVVYLMQLCVLVSVLTGLVMLRQQPRRAAVFLLPMSVLLGSIVLAALRVLGILSESALTLIALELGTTLAAILMVSSLLVEIYLEKAAIARTQQLLLDRNLQLSQLQQQEIQRSKISAFYGLGSRLVLTELLNNQLASPNLHYRLLLLELQSFDQIEAVLGQQKTAEILQAYISQLQTFCKQRAPAVVSLGPASHETLFSLSPDKLALLVLEQDFVVVLTGLRKLMNQKFSLDGISPDFKPRYASVAVNRTYGDDAEALLANGLLALTYVDKTASHRSYQPQLTAESRQRLTLISELAKATQSQQLNLLFQPVQDIATQQVSSLEAFLRWQHPTLGAVSPAVFIPLAEEAGLMNNLTAWVYSQARKSQNQLFGQGFALPVSINLSAQDLANSQLIQTIVQHEQKYPKAQRVKFELAESAMNLDTAASQRSLELIKKSGTVLVMDDFGAGQSFIGKLASLPISEIKIDMALLSMLGTQKEMLLAAAIKLGKSLDLTVICEGVEHQKQYDFLTLHNADAVQGYLVARPMPLEDLIAYLTAQQQQQPDNTVEVVAQSGQA
ncbi:EAL domain-containing protein [Rheinheimera riviphila]|uniref:EAL domain-containing protein n=1 Tax=Rheinheimera riviphila TaxID=1834037 RepID=A0A437QBL5_9GAMM|nr:EAL domain-containing protein [Rheinheimera riviphila]RVU31944.1 EAL domain-containing protein [Rheinheimera riviphila]